jgi:GNAT superfamily N-acetyltransferase
MEARELHEGELDDLLALYAHLHAQDDPLPGREAVEAVWRDIRDGRFLRCLGVFAEGELVSSCMLSVIPNLSRGCRPYGIVENVVTRTDRRRRGYGTAVLRKALALARESNCYKVMLLTGRKDEGVFRFYESAGFDGEAKRAFVARPG